MNTPFFYRVRNIKTYSIAIIQSSWSLYLLLIFFIQVLPTDLQSQSLLEKVVDYFSEESHLEKLSKQGYELDRAIIISLEEFSDYKFSVDQNISDFRIDLRTLLTSKTCYIDGTLNYRVQFMTGEYHDEDRRFFAFIHENNGHLTVKEFCYQMVDYFQPPDFDIVQYVNCTSGKQFSDDDLPKLKSYMDSLHLTFPNND